MAETPTIRVHDYCGGQPPYVLAKNEAINLLEAITAAKKEAPGTTLTLDFADISGLSASGSRVLIYGIVRRFGPEELERLLWVNVDDVIANQLEDATDDVMESLGQHPSERE